MRQVVLCRCPRRRAWLRHLHPQPFCRPLPCLALPYLALPYLASPCLALPCLRHLHPQPFCRPLPTRAHESSATHGAHMVLVLRHVVAGCRPYRRQAGARPLNHPAHVPCAPRRRRRRIRTPRPKGGGAGSSLSRLLSPSLVLAGLRRPSPTFAGLRWPSLAFAGLR